MVFIDLQDWNARDDVKKLVEGTAGAPVGPVAPNEGSFHLQ